MEKFLIGKIIKPQGVKGELKLSLTDTNAKIYKNVTHVYLNNSDEQIKVQNFVVRQGFGYLTIPTCKDRNQAELFRNTSVYANKEQIDLGDLTYFVDDIIDADVVSENGEFIGTLVEITNYGSTDIFTVIDENGREMDVPFLSSIFVEINKERVVVNKEKFFEVVLCE